MRHIIDFLSRSCLRVLHFPNIVVLVNDEQAARQTPLADGDRVEFIINMVGG
ncbi:MAG: MoaD/ThiS family protein [Chloroflexi bacterium]|nr:MoaD/ThiS family protein [Chloroflexota bacterium]